MRPIVALIAKLKSITKAVLYDQQLTRLLASGIHSPMYEIAYGNKGALL